MALPKTKRSGGPKTPAGRQAVAYNALRTGAYSGLVVLPGEDPAQFEQLQQQFVHDFAPADVAESALIQQLAVITWKKLRLDRIEHSHFLQLIASPYMDLELQGVRHLLPGSDALALVNQIAALTPAQRDALAQAHNLAQDLIDQEDDGYTAEDATYIAEASPELYDHLTTMAQEITPPPEPEEWHEANQPWGKSSMPFITWACRTFRAHSDHLDALRFDRDTVEQALQQLQEKRIFTFMRQRNTSRLHDDLDRAFQRTLAELRRQQNWRRDRATVTVEPTSTLSSGTA